MIDRDRGLEVVGNIRLVSGVSDTFSKSSQLTIETSRAIEISFSELSVVVVFFFLLLSQFAQHVQYLREFQVNYDTWHVVS